MSYNATSKLSQKILDGELSLYGECDTIGDGIPLYPGTTKKDIMDLRDKFVPRPSNIFVTSYQRSGTNWISYIIQLICNNGVTPDKDLDQFSVCIDDMTLKEFEAMEPPNVIKYHHPYEYVAGGPPHKSPAKYIYSYRNPRDVAVSLFHLYKSLESVRPPVWHSFLDDFISGNVVYGCQLDHIKGWWEYKDSPNILILSYENMKKDTVGVVQSISTFLGYQLSQKVIEDIALNARIDKMKKNLETLNSDLTTYEFVRKGVVGGWRSYFSTEDIAKLDAAVKEKLGDIDIVFDYGDSIA